MEDLQEKKNNGKMEHQQKGFLSRFDVALNGPSSNVMSQRITPERKTK